MSSPRNVISCLQVLLLALKPEPILRVEPKRVNAVRTFDPLKGGCYVLIMNKEQWIRVRGARQNNLKNVDLDVPREALTAFSGPSGSGKSSLAFQTLFAEGQRRYVESLSAHSK